MKKILTFIISLLLLQDMYAQTLVGKWKINFLLDNNYPPDEYVLLPTKPDTLGYEFGSILILKPDGTFNSYSIPGCGQDRFPPSTYGKYTIIDENYINFFLEKKYKEHETLINKDFGKYYYYQKDDGFRFIKSSGNLERDKHVVYYRDLLSTKDKEIKEYENVLDWKQTKIKDEKEVVSFCLAENQIENFEILYSQPVERYRQTIFLIKVGNDFRYVIYDRDYNLVALYDDYQINKIIKLISDIDKDKNLKTKTLKETYIPQRTSSENNTITVYQKKNQVCKAVYNQNFIQGGGWFTTIYFENKETIYVKFEEKSIHNQEERSSIIGCYILDINKNKIITKTIKSETGEIHFPSDYYQRAMDDIKKQLK
jgi:hypothetical protein